MTKPRIVFGRIITVLAIGLPLLLLGASLTFGAGGEGNGSPPPGGNPPSPDPSWPSYGYAYPGDSQYGFGYPAPTTYDSFSLMAKGNVVVGDYTSGDFTAKVIPNINGTSGSKTKPYVVDPTDASLGYDSEQPSLCGGQSPCFDGNYDQYDNKGVKSGEGTSTDQNRKFYESTLQDSYFHSLVDLAISDPTARVTIDAVLFTNHALAAYVKGAVTINGAMVSRDDALIFGSALTINQDVRLLDNPADLGLPSSIVRPTLRAWVDCSAHPDQCL